VAKVYRTEDRSFGTEVNVGGGVGIEWGRVGLDVDGHRTRLTPLTFQCGVVGVPCVGEAREGFEQATMLSANIRYFFGSRVRPYAMGSVGMLWTERVHSLTVVSGTVATLSEFRERDTSLALGFGVGVDVPLTRALSLRPEFRTYSSTAMSRVNLGLHRGTIGLRYQW
jgi:opacity protein-like surface antigen